jgi:hypothetical protein
LAGERLTGKPASVYQSGAMQRGSEIEPEARHTYEVITGNNVDQVGFIKLDSGIAGASPDGLIGKDKGLEIKAPETHNHLAIVLAEDMPGVYKPQVQGNLWISEREVWDFVSYDDRVSDSGIVIYPQHRDEKYINMLSEELEKFSEELEQMMQRLRQ